MLDGSVHALFIFSRVNSHPPRIVSSTSQSSWSHSSALPGEVGLGRGIQTSPPGWVSAEPGFMNTTGFSGSGMPRFFALSSQCFM